MKEITLITKMEVTAVMQVDDIFAAEIEGDIAERAVRLAEAIKQDTELDDVKLLEHKLFIRDVNHEEVSA